MSDKFFFFSFFYVTCSLTQNPSRAIINRAGEECVEAMCSALIHAVPVNSSVSFSGSDGLAGEVS